MLTKSWTFTAVLLTISLLAGCESNRFSRHQYAALEADPFLTADATPPVPPSGVIRAGATDESRRGLSRIPDQTSFDNTARPLVAPETVAPETATAAVTTPESSAGHPAPSANSFDDSAVASREPAAADDSGSGFDAWLQKNTGPIVQSSAEFVENIDATTQSYSNRVQQADFTTFPGERPRFEDMTETPAAAPAPVEPATEVNPFAAMDASSGAPDADDGGLMFDDEEAWSPPAGFQFE